MTTNILVVDDSPINRKLVGVTVASEGYNTLEAGDGLEALNVLGSEVVSAVICDVLMPNMDGYSLCAAVRRIERLAAMPFIFLTSARVAGFDEKLAFGIGADLFLRRPVNSGLISEAIKQLLARRPHASMRPLDGEELDSMRQYGRKLWSMEGRIGGYQDAAH